MVKLILFTRIYFIIIVLGMYYPGITFGHGLGDLAYLFLMLAWIIALSIILKLIRLKSPVNKAVKAVIITALVASVLYITAFFTVYRGSEYPWNGHVFRSGSMIK